MFPVSERNIDCQTAVDLSKFTFNLFKVFFMKKTKNNVFVLLA